MFGIYSNSETKFLTLKIVSSKDYRFYKDLSTPEILENKICIIILISIKISMIFKECELLSSF